MRWALDVPLLSRSAVEGSSEFGVLPPAHPERAGPKSNGVDPVRSRTMLRQAELSRDLFVVLMWQVPA